MWKKTALLLIAISLACTCFGQHAFKAIIKDSITHESIVGAVAILKGTSNGAVSDFKGHLNLTQVPPGNQTIVFQYIGYRTKEQTFTFPLSSDSILIFLSTTDHTLEEIIVEGTRSNKSIGNIPTRVEVLTEEIDEASTMDPSKVAHLLTHSTGIQVQQTSATSNTANVRIQGLDGRYTQILKDGFPLYGGFSGSLSIMQIPPLDLRQVEYIKGSASTLYGGGAISGLINLISKEPTPHETLIHLNASHIGAVDMNTFISRKVGKIGFTLLMQRNTHRYFDADEDGFSDMPELTKYNVNPKVFFYFNKRTKASLGATLTNEIRKGGDTRLLQQNKADSVHFYKERNNIERATTQFKLEHKINESHHLTIRNSFSFFSRKLVIVPSKDLMVYEFSGNQVASFSEVAYTLKHKENVLITGVNFYSDNFKETPLQTLRLRNEVYHTLGAFANYSFDLGKKVSIESGLRCDAVNGNTFLLPRLSALFKWTSKLTTRVGGGMGYRNPTVFNPEAELYGYRNILPVDTGARAEKSYGGNIDIGYKLFFAKHFFINVNQMFFMTYLDQPLILQNVSNSATLLHFRNANGLTKSMGGETFFKFGFYDFVLFTGYTYTHARNHFNGMNTALTLTPTHSIKSDLLYSVPGKWRIGMDAEFKSSQVLGNGSSTASYWTYGLLLERTIRKYVLFINVENFMNVRQTKFASLRSAPYDTPQFTEVWAPLDGIVWNAGIKVKL